MKPKFFGHLNNAGQGGGNNFSMHNSNDGGGAPVGASPNADIGIDGIDLVASLADTSTT